MKQRYFVIGLLLLVSVLAVSCTDDPGDDPRKMVMALFGAMERDDEGGVANCLDLAALMKNQEEDYSTSTDKPRLFVNPRDILLDLTGDGLTKRRWFSYQRIVGSAEVTPEHAVVEVTFVDKEASKGYKTKFGLHKVNEKWRIYSFKTFRDAY